MKVDMHDQFIVVKIPHKLPTLLPYIDTEIESIIDTFTAIVDLSRFNNSCLKLPASTLVNLIFQSHVLRSFSLNQLRDLSL